MGKVTSSSGRMRFTSWDFQDGDDMQLQSTSTHPNDHYKKDHERGAMLGHYIQLVASAVARSPGLMARVCRLADVARRVVRHDDVAEEHQCRACGSQTRASKHNRLVLDVQMKCRGI